VDVFKKLKEIRLQHWELLGGEQDNSERKSMILSLTHNGESYCGEVSE